MPTPSAKLEQLAEQLKELSETLAKEEASQLPAPRAKRVRKTISEAYDKLRKVIESLDPVKHPGFVFEPSNPNVAGRIVGIAMIAQPRKPLAAIEKFYGSGVYALYYNGGFKAYKGISKKEHPIYVGKADPADPAAKTAIEQGERLAGRLSDHRKNIAKAETTLSIDDFEYRALVVQTGYQMAAEDYLIHLFKPIWNSETGICYGLGKHGDDPGTRANLRSPWDTLHPGRDWAHRDPKMKDARAAEEIVQDISEHLGEYPPLNSVDQNHAAVLERDAGGVMSEQRPTHAI
jgi:hypothetical protein